MIGAIIVFENLNSNTLGVKYSKAVLIALLAEKTLPVLVVVSSGENKLLKVLPITLKP